MLEWGRGLWSRDSTSGLIWLEIATVMKRVFWGFFWVVVVVGAGGGSALLADDEDLVVTPAGFSRAGVARSANGAGCGRVRITVRDRSTNRLAPCRVTVVGADGDFYQPAAGRLSPYSLTGRWPETGKGNRTGKGPFRYLGRFFYTTGEVEVAVPAGSVRIEIWKGFQYRPVERNVTVSAGGTVIQTFELERATPMAAMGYFAGDLHLHFPRRDEADDQTIFDLLEAEDIDYGFLLAYNEPPGPYNGLMETMASPQLRGLGAASERRRGQMRIVSGQEYRSTTYGHLNLYGRDELVLAGRKTNADNWPLYGQVGRETIRDGGLAIYAHGGYSQAIHADFVQMRVSAVELLQFGVYRGIELAGWYDILNIGYRLPCVGASDYPACRKLGDCQTFARLDGQEGIAAWLRALAAGRSFVTNGPLLLLEVDGKGPGEIIRLDGTARHRVRVSVRVISHVAPVQNVQIIAGGRIVAEAKVQAESQQGRWSEIERTIEVDRSSWIAARALGVARSGAPDAEAHTNPVYVDIGATAPYSRDSMDRLIAHLDGQMAIHRKRSFAEKARVLDDFQKSRDILLRIRQAGGAPEGGVPDDWIEDNRSRAAIDPSRRSHGEEELKGFLEPLPALEPQDALKIFEDVDRFTMELVAEEPRVQSPAAAAFDEDGDLYVAEMRDYPYKPKPGAKPLGTVRLLRDRDGRFEESHVFAQGLLWAAGIAPWKGGVFVTAPPDIWYLKDTDGDGKADVRQLMAQNNLAHRRVLVDQGPTFKSTRGAREGATEFVRLVELLEPREPPVVRVAAVRGLAEINSADAARILLPRLRGFEPSVRASLTLKRGDGAEDTILRGQVAEISSTGLSLMPEGFEKRVSKPEMADLIAYLCASHRGGDSRDDPGQDDRRPLDIGTLPGLIEPDE